MEDVMFSIKTNSRPGMILLILCFSILKIQAQVSVMSVADSLYTVGHYAEAIDELEKIPTKTETVHLKLAQYQAAHGNLSEALEHYESVLNQNPNKLLTALDYGKTLMKAGRLKTADSLFSALTEKYPQNAHFKYQQGIIKEKLKDSTATDYFRSVIVLDKHHQGALYKVAKRNLEEKQFRRAEELCKQGLEANGNNASLTSILAQTFSISRQFGKAVPQYEKLLELGRESEYVFTQLGYALYQIGNYNKAIDSYEQALAIEDRNSNTHLMLGKLYAITGDLEKSETHLLMTVLIKDQPVDVEYLHLALTYKLQKKYKEALKYLNRALEENPDHERALYERAIAADNYFADLETKVNYYQAYLNKYEANGNSHLINLAKLRIHDLKTEIHLSEDKIGD